MTPELQQINEDIAHCNKGIDLATNVRNNGMNIGDCTKLIDILTVQRNELIALRDNLLAKQKELQQWKRLSSHSLPVSH
jgi:hypothetical protein